jgi:hypothetical protein
LIIFNDTCAEIIWKGWDPGEERLIKRLLIRLMCGITGSPSDTSHFGDLVYALGKFDDEDLGNRP